MKTALSVRALHSLLIPVILVFLSSGMTGCGPHAIQSGFLASWSRDGSRVALVPDCLNQDGDSGARKSGILMYDRAKGAAKQIISSSEGLICLHPQWSPFSNDLLFVTVVEDKDETPNDGEPDAYAVWVVGPDGEGLRQIAAGSFLGSGENGITLLLPNAVAWGDRPGTLLLQQRVGDKVTAILFDPYTGAARRFLPDNSDGYSLEPSPDRRKIAALQYDSASGLARLFISDFGYGNWRLLGTLEYDSDQLEAYSPMIYWAPDSSRFVIPEGARGSSNGNERPGFLRLFDSGSGRSRRIGPGSPQSVIQWSRDGRSFVFSAVGADESDLTIYRVDADSGRQVALIPDGENHLMAWNREDERIYYYRTFRQQESQAHELFSCAADGLEVRAVGFSFGGERPSWSSSPRGGSLLVFAQSLAPALLDLAPGRLTRLSF